MSMLMRFATSMMNNASEGMEAEHAAKVKAQEAAKAEEKLIMTELWKNELGVLNENRKQMMSNPSNYVNNNGVTLKEAYPELLASDFFAPEKMKTFEDVRAINAIFELFAPIPEADPKTVKGHTELLKMIANRSDSEAKFRKILEGPDKHSVTTFWKNYSQTDEWQKLLADAGGSDEGYMKAFKMYNSFKKVEDEDKGAEDEDLHTMFTNLNLPNTYAYPKQTATTTNSAYINVAELDSLFLNNWDKFKADWDNQKPDGKKSMLTELMTEIGTGAQRYINFYIGALPSFEDEMKREEYLRNRVNMKDGLLKGLYDKVKKSNDPSLRPILNQIHALDSQHTFDIVAAVEEVFTEDVDMASTTNENVEPNNRLTSVINLNESEKTKIENFALTLGYTANPEDGAVNTARQALFKDNPHAGKDSLLLAASMLQLKKSDGESFMFASSDPSVPTLFANNRDITSLERIDQQTLGNWVGSQLGSGYTDFQIATALGLLSSSPNKSKSKGWTVGDSGHLEDLRSTVRDLLTAINWVNPQDDGYNKVIEQAQSDPVGAYATAQTLVNSSYGLGLEIIDKVDLYLKQIAELPKPTTGVVQKLTNAFANFFGAEGSTVEQMSNIFGGDNVMGMTSIEFQATLAEKGELRNAKDNTIKYGTTLEYMNAYVNEAMEGTSGETAYNLGRAAAIRMYVAYKLAKYFDPAGRISDKDLKNQLDSFFGDGANVSIPATLGMLTGAVDIVRDRQKVLDLVRVNASLVLDDGSINKQLVNRINGVKHYKTLMQDRGFRLAIHYQNTYKPINGRDIIRNTGQTTEEGHTIYQLMNKDKTGRLEGAPLYGIYYSSDDGKNAWNGEWTYVPSSEIRKTGPKSEKTSTEDAKYEHWKDNVYITSDENDEVTAVYVKTEDGKYEKQDDFSLLQ